MKDIFKIIRRIFIRIKEILIAVMIFFMFLLIPYFLTEYDTITGIYWILFSVITLILYLLLHVNLKKSFCKEEVKGKIVDDITLDRQYDTRWGWLTGPYLYIVEFEYKGRKRKKSILSLNNLKKKIVRVKICKWLPIIIYIY